MQYKSNGDIIKFTNLDIKRFKRLVEFIQYLNRSDEFDSTDPSSWTHPMWKEWRKLLQFDSIHSQVRLNVNIL